MTTQHPHEGRVAWVTGGSSGIGAKTVELLLADGATVGVLDLQAPTEDLPWVSCDVSDPAAVKRATAKLRRLTGDPDILVNNAGLGGRYPITELPDEIWRRDMGVNLDGPFHMIRETMGHMMAQGWGRIISVTSTTAVRPVHGNASYAASKAGMIALAKTAALEGAPFGVTSNLVAPGVTETPLTVKNFGSSEALREKATNSHIANPMGTVNEPIDIAVAIRFLSLPEARHITGELIYVNGGAVMA
jgi:NAD(P)-dependent dehydrogenase (short-subunit alcohol dehydrogenase family)